MHKHTYLLFVRDVATTHDTTHTSIHANNTLFAIAHTLITLQSCLKPVVLAHPVLERALSNTSYIKKKIQAFGCPLWERLIMLAERTAALIDLTL
jgi:hypothetical protein